MRRQKDYTLYLGQIIDQMEWAMKDVDGSTFEEFKNDERQVRSGVNAVQNIGEASNRIPPSIKEKYVHLEIPWKGMRDMRSELVHDDNILLPKLWKTIKKDIPRDLPKIQEMRRLEELRMKKVREREERDRGDI